MQAVDLLMIPEVGELVTGPHCVSLWDALVEMLQGPSEVDFVRAVIDDMVTMNASASQELSSLLEILSDLRATNRVSPSTVDKCTSSPVKLVPLSSANKELLQERLRQLIATARIPAEEMFKTPRERQIVDLVVRPPSSVGSSRSRSFDSRPTSVGSCSSRNTFVDPGKSLASFQGSLRFDKIHEVRDRIRECFKIEYDQIIGDVEYIRELIDEEMHEQNKPTPSMTELRDMAKKVEEAEQQYEHMLLIQRLPAPLKRGSLASLH